MSKTGSVVQVNWDTSLQVEEEAANYCPVCSKKLQPRSCKLICVSCGYYMSCSDFC